MTDRKPKDKSSNTSLAANTPLALNPLQLRRVSDPKMLDKPVETNPLVGQDRARSALQLATEIRQKSHNLFVASPRDIPIRDILKPFLAKTGIGEFYLSDYAYAYNFEDASAPKLLTLPAGAAPGVADAFDELIRDLREAIPAAFEKPEVKSRRRALENTFKDRQENAFEQLGQDAEARSVAIMRGPMGFSLVPTKDDQVLTPADLKTLDEAQQEERKATLAEFQERLEEIVRAIPEWERSLRSDLRNLKREIIEAAITQSIEATREVLCEMEPACAHLESVKRDLIQNGEHFFAIALSEQELSDQTSEILDSQNPFERYSINVLVTRATPAEHVPVIEETNPTLAHLVGRVEHRSEGGYLTTSFKLIKPGALHQANGGFLILDARSLLSEPMSWRALKRAIQSGSIKTENLAEALSLTSTISLDPEPVPLSARIILIGDAWIYHILSSHDPEFRGLFKLFADIEDSVVRTEESEALLASMYRDIAQDRGLLDPSPDALAFLLEDAARQIGDAGRLSVQTERISDLLLEADQYAGSEGASVIERQHIEKARSEQIYRAGRIRDRMQEQLLRDIALVETDGQRIGQVNGLSVYELAGAAFGKPSRITARTRPGNGQIVDIEREARLGGPIHSKGVMVLSGYLAGQYALDSAFSLRASIVLEQSYGGVEGDSASLAELLAVLSCIAKQPINQFIAVTGAINQLGDVQAIGGVNEKIEGFFDLCKDRGLTGHQAVVIPSSNVQHLMLRPDVVDACANGTFAVYGVARLDEAIPILFNTASDQLHLAVENKLAEYASAIKGNGVLKVEETLQTDQAPFSLPDEVPPDAPPAEPPKAPPKARNETERHNER